MQLIFQTPLEQWQFDIIGAIKKSSEFTHMGSVYSCTHMRTETVRPFTTGKKYTIDADRLRVAKTQKEWVNSTRTVIPLPTAPKYIQSIGSIDPNIIKTRDELDEVTLKNLIVECFETCEPSPKWEKCSLVYAAAKFDEIGFYVRNVVVLAPMQIRYVIATDSRHTVGALRASGWSTDDINNLTKPSVIPKKKKIDMTRLIASQVDCEFTDHNGRSYISKLDKIDKYFWSDKNNHGCGGEPKCKPRHNHLHAFVGSTNPLPDGVLVKVRNFNTLVMSGTAVTSQDIMWQNVIHFEVIGPADGFEW